LRKHPRVGSASKAATACRCPRALRSRKGGDSIGLLMPGSFPQCRVPHSNWKSSCKRGPGPQSDMDVHASQHAQSVCSWHGTSRELYGETDDAEYGRDARTPGEQGRPADCYAPVVGMGAARGVDPERSKQKDGKRQKGYGRPKNPVNGTFLRKSPEPPWLCRKYEGLASVCLPSRHKMSPCPRQV
jgi:hypothetical protein